MTVVYQGCGEFKLQLGRVQVTLSEVEIEKIKNFNFEKMVNEPSIIEELNEKIEDLLFDKENFYKFVEKIDELMDKDFEEIEDLKDAILELTSKIEV
jgi:hypothetical protein